LARQRNRNSTGRAGQDCRTGILDDTWHTA